jgi:hypothetical protein
MIIWGGVPYPTDGGCYNPAVNSWTAVTTNGAPVARGWPTAVWTGSQMIVWGGFNGTGYVNDGGCYNPAANSWPTVITAGAPPATGSQAAIWTGSEMIVWGGEYYNGSSEVYLNSGGRYNPSANRWTAMTTNATPTGRYYPAAVWTGSEMIVWGGSVGGYLADTWSYYPYAPALRIFQASPNSAVVSWPVWSTTFGLYQCSDLATANWTSVTNAVNQVGSVNQVTLSPLTSNQFYVLCYP